MLYRIAHALNTWYALAVAWTYIGAFALGLSLLFVFPQVTLLLLFCRLASLGFAVMIGWMIDGLASGLAKRALAAGRCPHCGAVAPVDGVQAAGWTCEHCATEFAADGRQIDPRERERWVVTDE